MLILFSWFAMTWASLALTEAGFLELMKSGFSEEDLKKSVEVGGYEGPIDSKSQEEMKKKGASEALLMTMRCFARNTEEDEQALENLGRSEGYEGVSFAEVAAFIHNLIKEKMTKILIRSSFAKTSMTTPTISVILRK